MGTPIPANDAAFTLSEVVRATGGQVLSHGNGPARGVTTDSRTDVGGSLFVALAGEQFDAHEFVPEVVRRGAAGVVVSREVRVAGPAFVVRVASALDALGALARLHRQRWGGTVIAVGGSAGKTTTRSAIAAALNALMPGAVHCAAGNLNNRVGLPMVLLGVQPRHRSVVVEAGTNLRGEVSALARVCEPDLAVLTLIALEHAAGLGGLDDIEREEGDLLAALRPAGTAVANGDDERARRALRRSPASTQLTYGASEGCAWRLLGRRWLGLRRSELTLEYPADGGRARCVVQTSLLGQPGALAALAAVAVADRLSPGPWDPSALTNALCDCRHFEPGRLVPLILGDGTVVLDDTYNANPASVRASVATAQELACSRPARLLLVIGEMRELGAWSRPQHTEIGEELARSGAAALVAIGGDAESMARAACARGLEAVFAPDGEAALPLVLARMQAGDVVLVKASRGLQAERVVAGLRAAKGAAA
jgi:UDP-N-acetylmuramoyl-tripeptide--D-alanyl-D-alanine ligase